MCEQERVAYAYKHINASAPCYLYRARLTFIYIPVMRMYFVKGCSKYIAIEWCMDSNLAKLLRSGSFSRLLLLAVLRTSKNKKNKKTVTT